MSKLYFRVGSDWEEVVRLRNEIAKLQQELKGINSTQSPTAFKALNIQLSASTQRMNELVTNAAKAGTVIEGDFRKKIFDASQTVNSFTEKIIAQKAVVKDVEADVRRLGDAYRIALKNSPLSANSKLSEYKSAQKALGEEKAALFGLTQEQANARLSVKKLRDEYALYKNDGKQVIETNKSIGLSLGKALGVIGGVAALKRLGSEIIRVRGEFQSMQTAIETMVGKDIAGQLIPQIKELAKISPLTMSDMVGAEKMMLGFNIQAEDTIKYLKALSDISMGESGKFNSLTLAFSQMSAAGKLMGQDLNQMINAGFNPLQTIAEKTGKSIATLKNEMSKGAISAEMVQQAFLDATSAGGKFYNMSENASKTINGQLSMMHDALDNAFNEIGKASEGVIMKGIQTTTSLIQNYEQVGKVLTGLIVVYGTYKTALFLAMEAEKGYTIAQSLNIKVTLLAEKAQKALNLAVLKNPYVLAAVAVVGLVSAMWAFHDSTTAAEKAQKRFNEEKEQSIKQEQEHKQKLEELISAIQSEYTSSLDRVKAMDLIKENYPSIFRKYIDEKGHIRDLISLWKEYNEEVSRGKVTENKKNYTDSKTLIDEYQKIIGLWNKFGNDPNFHKNALSAEEKTLADKYKNETLSTLKSKLDEEKQILVTYQKEVRADELAQWQLDLKKKTDVQIKSELDEMKRIQHARKNNPRYSLSVGVGSLKGMTTESELQQRIAILESEYNIKKRGNSSYKEDYEKAKKAWEDAKKALAEIEKDKSKFTTKQYEEAKKLKESTEKAYKDLGGITGSSLTKQENQAKREAEKKLQQQQKLSDDLLSLYHKNQQEEIDLMEEGKKRKLKQIDADFEAQKTAIQKKSREFAEANKKAGITGLNANGLTAEQQSEIDKANKLNADSRAKAETDMYKAETEAMRNFLKEYGTFQQQKLAIAEEYAKKIRKAQSEGERLSLIKQRDAALVNIDVQAAQQNIDWQSIFGDLGMMLREQIQPTIDNLKTIIQSDEFQSSSVEDRQKIYDILSQLEQQSGALGNGLFKEVAMDLEIYRNSLNAYNKAQQREIEATNRLIEAKNKLKLAQENGGDVDAAKQAVDEAQEAFNRASESVKTLGDKASENAQTLKTSSEKARGAIEGFASGLSKLKSGSLQQVFEGIKGIGSTLGGKLGDAISNIDPTGIISGVLGLLDILKDGVSTIFVSLQDTLFGAIEGILNDVLSGDIVTKTWSNAMSHVGNILNTVTFGGFNSLFGIGGNAKKVQEAIDRLTDRNETLEKSIDRLSDVMEKEAGSKSISAYEQAYKYQEEHNKNTLEIAREQASYHNSHKSWQYYMKWDDEQLQWARDNVDENFSGTDSLWGLTPEQMKALLSNADIYDHMKNAGAGGYGGRVMEKLEAYADNAEKLDELTERINESLMQVSFDSLRDSFLDSLMDMDKDAKGFSEDFSEYMQRALLNFSMGEMFDEDLKEWYDGIAKLMKEQGGELTKEQLDDARKEYDGIVKDALNERDKLAQITGYTGGKDEDSEDGRKAAQKGIATASQDSIDELKGTMTNVQGHTYSINENTARIATGINTLTEHTKHLTCLADIDNTMQSLLTMRKESIEHLSNIAEYTSNLVEMKEFMRSMKAGIDTLNTKGVTLKR